MKESIRRVIHFILVIVLLATSIFTVFYYWTATTTSDLRSLPTSLLTVIIFYILAQLIKRYVKKSKWYDWIYYLGLIAILLPLPLFSSEGGWIFSTTKYGSLLLFIPPLIELLELVFSKKK